MRPAPAADNLPFVSAAVMDEQAAVSDISSPSFQAAELRSEQTRVTALLIACALLLLIVLLRGALAVAAGRYGEAWPFAVLIGAMAVYEALWLRVVKSAIAAGQSVSRGRWSTNILVESLVPTLALFLQIHTPSFGPERTLSSPVVLLYLIFVILSTLRLDRELSRLAGLFAAVGYAAASVYILVSYPEIARTEPLVVYGSFLSTVALLVLGGLAAGTVARQIRQHVIAALRDAENRAKIAQLEHDLDVARRIQQGLFPTTAPSLDGFEIAGWNQPADETGGDYYDWQPLADGRLAVTVADATGHGIAPALIMSACRAYSRAGFATDPDLQRLIDRLNRLLHQDLPEDKFVTLVTALLKPGDGAVQLISAGHGPLIFYSAAEEKFYCFDAQGPPLGLLAGIPYDGAHSIEFQDGDILALVTDGFIEWANAEDEDFGLRRLEDVIRAHRAKPPGAIISEMRDAVTAFAAGVRQQDDLTAVVIKRV
jgi:serine phosphatase RsbU (regulator of sigma subunit)